MNVWVKICGLSDASSVDAALAAGADAIGFVFASSPRQVSMGTALALKKHIAGRAAIVAVMRHPVAAVAARIARELRPDFVQTDISDTKTISLPDGVAFLPVVREGRVGDETSLPAQILYEGPHSGVGETVDWDRACALARRRRLVLAGGLRPDNITEAVRQVRPFGVDVSSGVESAPGVKDARLIGEFVAAVRAIEAKFSNNEERKS